MFDLIVLKIRTFYNLSSQLWELHFVCSFVITIFVYLIGKLFGMSSFGSLFLAGLTASLIGLAKEMNDKTFSIGDLMANQSGISIALLIIILINALRG